MDIGQVSAHVAFLAGFVWLLVQYVFKPLLKDTALDTNLIVVVVAALVGIADMAFPQIDQYVVFVGQVAATALAASTAHNIAVKSGTPPAA